MSLCLCESREQHCVTVQGDKVSTVQATREMHQRVFPDNNISILSTLLHCSLTLSQGLFWKMSKSKRIFFYWISSLSCDVCESAVCLSVPSWKTGFPVD